MSQKSASTLEQFESLFRGHSDNYVKHQPPFIQEENGGKIKASFVGRAEYKSRSKHHPAPPEGFEDGDKVPLSIDRYRGHLNGIEGIAVSPLIKQADGSDVVFYALIDIDYYQDDQGNPVYYTDLISRLYSFGYKFVAFQSKSGGLHIYFFYRKAEPAKKAKASIDKLVEVFGIKKAYKGHVETFPEHTTRNPGQWDKAVFLPFFGSKGDPTKALTQMISAEGELVPITHAMQHIDKMFTQVSEIDKLTASLPYEDAPYCIQQLLVNGALGQNTGRNEFMFSAALYLKTKEGPSFQKDSLEEMNQRLTEPLEPREIDSIFLSASTKDYQLFGRCNKEPCASVCDKQLCKLRKYGIGKEKDNTSRNIEFGKIYRYRGEEPYYMWEAKLAGTEEDYKLLRIDGAENLLNQKPVQRACIDVLGQTMITVKQTKWEEDLNAYLLNIEEREVTKSTDTSDMGALRNLFERFLTHRQNRVKQPYTVNVRQVYFENGTYYFRTDAFVEYLNIMKFNYARVNLREQLLRYACQEVELRYKTALGVEKIIKCWGKKIDDVLNDMTTFYDDIVGDDAKVIEENKLNKKDTYEADFIDEGPEDQPIVDEERF